MFQCGTGVGPAVQAWQDSFNPDDNPTARELVREWQQRLDRSQRRGGHLYFQYHTMFDAIVRARMGRDGEAIWTADQCAPASCGHAAACPRTALGAQAQCAWRGAPSSGYACGTHAAAACCVRPLAERGGSPAALRATRRCVPGLLLPPGPPGPAPIIKHGAHGGSPVAMFANLALAGGYDTH